MGSIIWLYQTKWLIIIDAPVTDVVTIILQKTFQRAAEKKYIKKWMRTRLK